MVMTSGERSASSAVWRATLSAAQQCRANACAAATRQPQSQQRSQRTAAVDVAVASRGGRRAVGYGYGQITGRPPPRSPRSHATGHAPLSVPTR